MQDRPDVAAAEGLGQLAGAWQQAEQYWHDEVGRRFGTNNVAPLLSEARAHLTALRRLLDVLEAADSACRDRAIRSGE
jgi:hypothetical protein